MYLIYENIWKDKNLLTNKPKCVIINTQAKTKELQNYEKGNVRISQL